MRKAQKFTAALIAASLAFSAFSFYAFAADTETSVSLRIEGAKDNLYYSDVVLESGSYTVADVISRADGASDGLTVTGADAGYISEINGEKAGAFGGWDGWYYTVNGVSPDAGVGDYTVSAGDEIVVYYGDYPCQLPQLDTSWFAANGTLKFTSNDTSYEYDEATDDWTAKTVTVPVAGMTVTLNGDIQLVTDENGCVKVDFNKNTFTSDISLQVSKAGASGAPAVCRYAPDFKISAPARECSLYGDADSNGKVNILDAAKIQLSIAKLTDSAFTPEQFIASDVNTSYSLDIKDAAAVQLYAARLISSLPLS